MDFHKFNDAVIRNFENMKKHDLFYTNVDKDAMWNTYLDSFPEGTNEIYRQRRHYDCSCCRQFVKTMGNVVAIVDNNLVSIWDIDVVEPFATVASAMSEFVKSKKIDNIFLHTERHVGTEKSFENSDNGVITWNHFYVSLTKGRSNDSEFYCTGVQIGPRQSEAKSTHDVFLRSLKEITRVSVDTTLELISQNSIYRGAEHKFAVDSFSKLLNKFNKLKENEKDNFVWANIKTVPASVSRIRNSAIGTLLVDLSNDVDLDQAVRSFETKVAPTNYKRPTALVTKAMVENARKTIADLNLTTALERRYAHLTDINVNDIIFANRETKNIMTGDVFDMVPTKNPSPKNFGKVEQVSIDTFIKDIVPSVETIEIMFDNKHVNNLVSLVAPVHSDANRLFKWDNNFSWSYNGDTADSIKERVKKAGGNVVGDLCCRLAWYNFDDLDFHMVEPHGNEIYFSNKSSHRTGGKLDVDMNAGGGHTRTPVENIFYASRTRMTEGNYKLFVHNFAKRETNDVGFEVEIDYLGNVQHFVYAKPLKDHEKVVVAEFTYTHKDGFKIVKSLPPSSASKTVWNIPTNEFHKVNVLMLSPNYWKDGNGVGNKHYFFMLDGCKNDGQARGFYNEFLLESLNPHRKVIELVGNKMKTDETDNQLSGLGFSSTQKHAILAKVKGNFTRMIEIVI